MPYYKQFRDLLDELWGLRALELIDLTERRPDYHLTYRRREGLISRTLLLAEESLVRKRWVESRFGSLVRSRGRVLVSGLPEAKRAKAWDRLEEYQEGSVVYSYWEGQRCRYVGRSNDGIARLWAPDERLYWKRTTRLQVLRPRQNRHLPQLECLAIHFYEPIHNRNRASRKMWSSKCFICEALDALDDELRITFAFRT